MPNLTDQIDLIVEWLRAKVKEANAQGLVVGVSGGVDSATVAALAKKAFPEASIGVIMPCHSDPRDEQDARLVTEVVGLKRVQVELSEPHQLIYDNVRDRLTTQGYEFRANDRLADANLRARLRMGTLYSIANLLNYLVVGTDNAAEAYTGYFTKYGDGGVDLLPLIQFTKREVRALARELGVPDRIINKPPSAGLWLGQTDEAEMGTTYEMIDDYLDGKPIPADHLARIEELHRRSEHKRQLPPSFQRTDRQLVRR
ncbi:MAG: NAD(+) synthase [Firmicutes bacterium]|nr:NAD(+) synthase [Bacillota bacterium]